MIQGNNWAQTSPDTKPAHTSRHGAIEKGQHIFYTGHSFHFYVPGLLQEVAMSAGITDQVNLGASMIGGSKTQQHWDVKYEDNQARHLLEQGAVDVLTTTPIYLPDEGVENFATLGYAHNPNIRVTMQEFWLPFDAYEPHYYDAPKIPTPATVDHNVATVKFLKDIHARYFKEMDALVAGINKKLGHQVVFVVPAGQAVLALREKIIQGKAPGLKNQEDLFVDPLGHPSPPLQALVTYCHFAVIYRTSPVGLPTPNVLVQSKIPSEDIPDLNHLLEEIAWNAVTHHPLSGVKGR